MSVHYLNIASMKANLRANAKSKLATHYLKQCKVKCIPPSYPMMPFVSVSKEFSFLSPFQRALFRALLITIYNITGVCTIYSASNYCFFMEGFEVVRLFVNKAVI